MGTSLHWLGELIVVDAPCGGIKMLWVGLYLNFTLACFANLSTWHTWVSYSLSTGIIFLGNLLRITALFFVESGIVQAPDQVHVVVGLFSFLIVTILVWYLNAMLKGREVRHA